MILDISYYWFSIASKSKLRMAISTSRIIASKCFCFAQEGFSLKPRRPWHTMACHQQWFHHPLRITKGQGAITWDQTASWTDAQVQDDGDIIAFWRRTKRQDPKSLVAPSLAEPKNCSHLSYSIIWMGFGSSWKKGIWIPIAHSSLGPY